MPVVDGVTGPEKSVMSVMLFSEIPVLCGVDGTEVLRWEKYPRRGTGEVFRILDGVLIGDRRVAEAGFLSLTGDASRYTCI
jgi:hypothetical protein